MQKRIEIGKIVNTHSLKGEVKVVPWCDYAEDLLEIEEFYIENSSDILYLEKGRVHKDNVLIKFKGIDTIEMAENLKNKILYAEENLFELEDNTYFIKDLIGLNVIDVDTNFNYGTITDVLQTGANDVYEVKNEKGNEYLVPAIKDCVISTDIEKGEIKIRPLEGLFD